MYQIYKAVIGKGDQMESDFEVFFDSIGTFLKYVSKLKGKYSKKVCIRTNNLDRLQYADAKCNVTECIKALQEHQIYYLEFRENRTRKCWINFTEVPVIELDEEEENKEKDKDETHEVE